uniref:Transcription factor TFIIE alpha subunit C-terminal domain-containing protein n=1 Tax=Denticeps clupeoides TaxID=299321 RepID=A0AAY4EII1_9TELE
MPVGLQPLGSKMQHTHHGFNLKVRKKSRRRWHRKSGFPVTIIFHLLSVPIIPKQSLVSVSGTFRCTFCQTETPRTLVARFNDQIEPIYVLLRETEDVNLSHELLEPEPTEIPALKQRSAATAGAMGAGTPHREAWSTKGSSYADLYTQNVEISMDEPESHHRQASEDKAPKERPVWLTESTVQGAYTEAESMRSVNDITGPQPGVAGRGAALDENEEVINTLMIYEKRGTAAGPAGGAPTRAHVPRANPSDSESDTSESDEDSPAQAPAHMAGSSHRPGRQDEFEEDEEDDEFEEVTDEPTVMVGGRPFSYSEVGQRPELVEQMSAQEKEAYIQMGQTLYQDYF